MSSKKLSKSKMCKNTRFGKELRATDDLISRTMFTNPDLGHDIKNVINDYLHNFENTKPQQRYSVVVQHLVFSVGHFNNMFDVSLSSGFPQK